VATLLGHFKELIMGIGRTVAKVFPLSPWAQWWSWALQLSGSAPRQALRATPSKSSSTGNGKETRFGALQVDLEPKALIHKIDDAAYLIRTITSTFLRAGCKTVVTYGK
jgi:hypothetical protein